MRVVFLRYTSYRRFPLRSFHTVAFHQKWLLCHRKRLQTNWNCLENSLCNLRMLSLFNWRFIAHLIVPWRKRHTWRMALSTGPIPDLPYCSNELLRNAQFHCSCCIPTSLALKGLAMSLLIARELRALGVHSIVKLSAASSAVTVALLRLTVDRCVTWPHPS